MNKAIGYTAIAITLGLAIILVPTWFFIHLDQQGQFMNLYVTERSATPPWLYSQDNNIQPISPVDMEILGISFVVASIVYILFKRKT